MRIVQYLAGVHEKCSTCERHASERCRKDTCKQACLEHNTQTAGVDMWHKLVDQFIFESPKIKALNCCRLAEVQIFYFLLPFFAIR